MRDDTESRLDETIDAVARSMTAGGPGPVLRGAVRARIERRTAGRPFWLYAATASAALIVLVMTWTGSNRPPVQRISPPVATVTEGTPAASEVDVNPTPATRTASRPLPPAAHPPVQIDLLDVVPLDVVPLEIPMIAVDALSVDPLVMQQ